MLLYPRQLPQVVNPVCAAKLVVADYVEALEVVFVPCVDCVYMRLYVLQQPFGVVCVVGGDQVQDGVVVAPLGVVEPRAPLALEDDDGERGGGDNQVGRHRERRVAGHDEADGAEDQHQPRELREQRQPGPEAVAAHVEADAALGVEPGVPETRV